MQFRVSKLSDWRYEALVLVHELVEYIITKHKDISLDSITKFDIEYEEARISKIKAKCGCKPTKDSEPGDDKHAPYYKAHQFATKVEKLLARLIGVNWKEYDTTIENETYN